MNIYICSDFWTKIGRAVYSTLRNILQMQLRHNQTIKTKGCKRGSVLTPKTEHFFSTSLGFTVIMWGVNDVPEEPENQHTKDHSEYFTTDTKKRFVEGDQIKFTHFHFSGDRKAPNNLRKRDEWHCRKHFDCATWERWKKNQVIGTPNIYCPWCLRFSFCSVCCSETERRCMCGLLFCVFLLPLVSSL